MAEEEFDMVRLFRHHQVFHLPDVGHFARFEIDQQILQVADQFLFRLALCLIVRIARATIRDAVGNRSTVSYWLDLGNNADSGQFILGEPLNERNRRSKLRLRTAAESYPEIVDPTLDNDGEPSCSAAAALERQLY
jgi:hypothetical protein